MKHRVYLETSIIGYLTSRPSRDLLTAASQQITHEWWNDHRENYELYVSRFVIEECSAGAAVPAQERLDVLAGIPRLTVAEAVGDLSEALLDQVPLPEKANIDALHIAVAAVNGVDYLLTWNCRHIANVALRFQIESVCRSLGFEPPAICTPQELMEA